MNHETCSDLLLKRGWNKNIVKFDRMDAQKLTAHLQQLQTAIKDRLWRGSFSTRSTLEIKVTKNKCWRHCKNVLKMKHYISTGLVENTLNLNLKTYSNNNNKLIVKKLY